jgi:cysteine desulfurase
VTASAVYLDWNATAPARPEAIEAVARAMSEVGNASSVHRFGRAARKLVEDAREAVAALTGAEPANVIFTGGGTEANNLALRGCGDRRLIVSAVEHGAVLAPALMRDSGAVILPVDADGVVDLEALDSALRDAGKPTLVSVMRANNETGVLQPVAEVVAIAHRHGALVHCDAVQAAGKIPFDMTALGVDLASFSAHKLGGPQGVGALVLRQDMPLDAQNIGGGQERGRRSGTENVAGIAGFGAAARAAHAGLAGYARVAELRDELERRTAVLAQDRRVLGAGAPRLPNTSNLTMPGVKAETQVMALDLEGVAVSAGSACSSGKVSASHVIAAMGVPDDEALTAIRVSLGWSSTAAEVDRFVEAWRTVFERCGRRAAA